MAIFSSLTVFLTLFLAIQGTYLEDVKKFTETFATFKNDSTDLEKLVTIAGNHEELAKHATAVGFLLAAGTHNSSFPGSDGDQALQFLNDELTNKFNLLKIENRNRHVPLHYSYYDNAQNDILRPLWFDYKREVSDQLAGFYYDYDYSTNFFLNFEKNQKKCSWNFLGMLVDMDRARYCGISKNMKEYIRNYVGVQQAVREAESRVKSRTSENSNIIEELLDDVKSRIRAYTQYTDHIFLYLSYERRIRMLEEINPNTLDDLLKELLYFSVKFPRVTSICGLHVEHLFYGFKKTDLLYVVQDLTKYQWIMIACTAAQADNFKSNIGREITYKAEKVAQIAQKYVTYYQSIQNLTWPEIQVEAAKRVVGFEMILQQKFNETAQKIQKELEKYIPEGYSYQILISETRQPDNYWSAISKTNDYANFTDLNGIDCHIFRYKTREGEKRQANATIIFEQHRQDLLNVLEKVVYIENTTDVLQQLLKTVDFYQNDVYNSAILLRNEAFFVNNSKILTGEAFLEGNNPNTVEFSINSFYKNARSWKFYLFI